MIDSDGYVTEGSSSNAWILIGDKLLTTLQLNFKGITWTSLIKAFKKESINDESVLIKDIKIANEAFITSAIICNARVKVDNILIGNGKVEKYAHIFKDAYGGNTIKIRNRDVSFIVHPALNGEPLYRSKELVSEIENLVNNLNIFIF